MRSERRAIAYKKQEIVFAVSYAQRKTLEIAVLPDSRVEVKAPVGTKQEEIHKRVRKRSRWIRKQQDYFRQFIPKTPVRKYVSGETHLYLGRQYRLKVAHGSEDEIKLKHGRFQIVTTVPEKEVGARRLIGEWYRQKAKVTFCERLNEMARKFKLEETGMPLIQIRKMRTRWGSLTRGNVLTLNLDLIRAPRECIDYVIAHELCHMVHHNHGRGFYRLLGKVMPDWEKVKNRLERIMSGN